MSWKIAFLGTHHPAIPTLESLLERKWVCLVVLPISAGAKNDKLLELAHRYEVPWTYDLSDIEGHELNLILAANYPKLVPIRYLETYPCINTHWSLLPKYRGVHPTAWSLINADYQIGFSIHWMKEEFDTGDILAQETVVMEPDMNIIQLHKQLADRQAKAVIRVLKNRLQAGKWESKQQINEQAIYVPQRIPEDGIIDWNWPTERIWNLVRALPLPDYPGAFTYHGNKKTIIWRARPADCPEYFSTVGQVVRVIKGRGVWIKTGDTCLEVLDIEIEGVNQGMQRADTALRLRNQLGYNPQLEIANLRKEVFELNRQLTELRKTAGQKFE